MFTQDYSAIRRLSGARDQQRAREFVRGNCRTTRLSGYHMCLPDAEGTGIFLGIVDPQVIGRSGTPALRCGRKSGAKARES